MRWVLMLMLCLAGCGGGSGTGWEWPAALMAKQAANPGVCLVNSAGDPYCLPEPGKMSCSCTVPAPGK